jgi:hypothetical protein
MKKEPWLLLHKKSHNDGLVFQPDFDFFRRSIGTTLKRMRAREGAGNAYLSPRNKIP